MSNLGGGEILVVLLMALIVLGPDKLPEAARKVGSFVRQVRQMSNGFQQEVRKAMELDPGNVPFHPEEARIRPVPDPEPETDEGSEVRAVHPDGGDTPDTAPVPEAAPEPAPTPDGGHDDGAAGSDGARATG